MMRKPVHEPDPRLLVLSADAFNHTVAPQAQINRIPPTRIYGDGRVVFIDPLRGNAEIFEGQLDADAISHLLEVLETKGFFGFAELYPAGPGMVGVGARVITAVRRGEPEKRVTCFFGAPSAPRAFDACYEALLYPHVRPAGATSYRRKPITPAELAQGWYGGLEYQKKLDTPMDWIWIDAGRSSKWCKRPALVPSIHRVAVAQP